MAARCDVLIVGLGPVGATLAALLVQQGVSVIAIDKDTDVYPLPRAAHFDHEIMRIFQGLGIADDVLRHTRVAPAYEFRAANGQVLMRFDLERHGAGGWPQGFMFNQPGVEQALRGLLSRSPLADVRLGRSFVSFEQTDDGIRAVLSGPNDEETVEARYLIGCDGARSTVREACGTSLDDLEFDEPWLVIDVVHGPDAHLPDINLQICDPARPTTCVLMGPGRHRWEFMLKPGESTKQALDDGFIRTLLKPWDCGDDIVIDRKAVYRFHGLVAKEWRSGRVLLAGDSAHQMPPFAGQGMCAGLRDAANLAWKLAAVLRGGKVALLDTYQREREPHVRQTIALAISMGRVVCTTDTVVAAQRDAQMLEQRKNGGALPPPPDAVLREGCLMFDAPGAGEIFPQAVAEGAAFARLDDILGPGAWLIARRGSLYGLAARSGVLPVSEFSLDDEALRPFAPKIARWLDGHAGEAALVRPDRYVFGTGKPDKLLAAFRSAVNVCH